MSTDFGGLDFTPTGAAPTREREEEVAASLAPEGLDFTPYTPSDSGGVQDIVRRGAGRTVARPIETLAGLPGDLQQLIKSGVKAGIGYVVGEEKAQKAGELAETVTQFLPGMNLPSSQDIREQVTQQLTGQYLEPESPGEELYDNIVSDVAALAVPVKGKIPFARALGTSVLANTSAEVAKSLGAGEKTQVGTKLGTMLVLGLLGRGGAQAHVNELHKEAASLIPKDATLTVGEGGKLITDLDKMQAVLRKGGITPSKTPALSLSRQLVNKIQQTGGELPIDELPAFRRSINELRFDKQLPPKTRFHLDRFDDVVSNQLENYGKENPAFLQKYRDANLGSTGLAKGNAISRAISKKVDISKLSPETLLILGLHTATPGRIAALVGTGILGGAASVLKRLSTNKVLQQYYGNVVKASLAGNTASMIKNVEGLDRQMRKGKE